ncbi:hypothetical protein [Flexivirga oryzae]|uniref:Uncharacterized protein n=1 Tax=Flexivirga oryzae TaxID=1794944 RepID=A0A839NBZ9_9MICO|nr:hypothetical protein [Flexivirga oryzae]MBB2893166.1 hypothetical protein [Flexivirga oryzae]
MNWSPTTTGGVGSALLQARVLDSVEEGEKSVVVPGFEVFAVPDVRGDADGVLDEPVVRFGDPDTHRGLGVPAGEELPQQLLDRSSVPIGDGFSPDSQPSTGDVAPRSEAGYAVGLGIQAIDVQQEVGIAVVQ